MNLGGAELLILAAIVILIFGAGWLPKAAKNLGKAKVEMDKAQQQFNEAKNTVVEATGVKELESTISKANKALNSSPKQLLKDAAKSTATGSDAADGGPEETNAEEASPDTDTAAGASPAADGEADPATAEPVTTPPAANYSTEDFPDEIHDAEIVDET